MREQVRAETLKVLRYDQTPQIVGPAKVVRSRFPGLGASTARAKK